MPQTHTARRLICGSALRSFDHRAGNVQVAPIPDRTRRAGSMLFVRAGPRLIGVHFANPSFAMTDCAVRVHHRAVTRSYRALSTPPWLEQRPEAALLVL